jgi:hypothetical protein
MLQVEGLKVLFVAGFGPIVDNFEASRRLYLETLGLPLKPMPDDPTYLNGENIDGVRHFALWPLAQAAQSCFVRRPGRGASLRRTPGSSSTSKM